METFNTGSTAPLAPIISQKIELLEKLLSGNPLKRKALNILSVVIEICMWVIFLVFILSGILIPVDFFALKIPDQNTSMQLRFQPDVLRDIMQMFKIVVILTSILPMIVALLLRNLRHKRNILIQACKELSEIKKLTGNH